MIRYAIKDKGCYLIDDMGWDYGPLEEAHLFKTKKLAQKNIKEATENKKLWGEKPLKEKVVKIEIKEIK